MKKLAGLIALLALLAGAYYLIAERWNEPAGNEHAGLYTDADFRIDAAKAGIVGFWRSQDDAKFTREFNPDGTVTDAYEGESSATVNDTWEISDNTGSLRLRIGQGAEALNFEIARITPEELELVYLDRGGVLRFLRVQK